MVELDIILLDVVAVASVHEVSDAPDPKLSVAGEEFRPG